MQGPQPGGGPGVVVVDVAADVPEVDAQTDPGGLVAHGVRPPGGPAPGVGVADVPHHQLGRRLGPREGALALGDQRVEDDDLVAGGHQVVDDVGADEAGPTGDEDACGHGSYQGDERVGLQGEGHGRLGGQPSPALPRGGHGQEGTNSSQMRSTSPRAICDGRPAPPAATTER